MYIYYIVVAITAVVAKCRNGSREVCVWCVYIKATRRVVQSVGHESSNSCNLGSRLVIPVLLPTLFKKGSYFRHKMTEVFWRVGFEGFSLYEGELKPPASPPPPPPHAAAEHQQCLKLKIQTMNT
ncbi:unnamed protein product [Arctogadus glacialis]